MNSNYPKTCNGILWSDHVSQIYHISASIPYNSSRYLPRLEWPAAFDVDEREDFCFCRFTVIITCSWTLCFPVPLVFNLWSEGKAKVELAWSWKHSYASAVFSGEWSIVADGGAKMNVTCLSFETLKNKARQKQQTAAKQSQLNKESQGARLAIRSSADSCSFSTLCSPVNDWAGTPSARLDIQPSAHTHCCTLLPEPKTAEQTCQATAFWLLGIGLCFS